MNGMRQIETKDGRVVMMTRIDGKSEKELDANVMEAR